MLSAGVYFACVMIMCTISVTTTVVVLNFHHRSPEMYEMPGWVGTAASRIRRPIAHHYALTFTVVAASLSLSAAAAAAAAAATETETKLPEVI